MALKCIGLLNALGASKRSDYGLTGVVPHPFISGRYLDSKLVATINAAATVIGTPTPSAADTTSAAADAAPPPDADNDADTWSNSSTSTVDAAMEAAMDAAIEALDRGRCAIDCSVADRCAASIQDKVPQYFGAFTDFSQETVCHIESALHATYRDGGVPYILKLSDRQLFHIVDAYIKTREWTQVGVPPPSFE